jgi:hypothetical protein
MKKLSKHKLRDFDYQYFINDLKNIPSGVSKVVHDRLINAEPHYYNNAINKILSDIKYK